MVALLGALFGFLGSIVPQLLKMWTVKQDHAHELAILNVQKEMAATTGQRRLEEVGIDADIREIEALHKPELVPEIKPTGVKIVDALVSVLYAMVMLLSHTVRPVTTYWFLFVYSLVKYAIYQQMIIAKVPWQTAIITVWGSEDMAIFSAVMAYWFGQRSMKYFFERKR